MIDPTIICPECKAEIKLTDSLAAPLIADARREMTQDFDAKAAALIERERVVKTEAAKLDVAKADLEGQVAERLST